MGHFTEDKTLDENFFRGFTPFLRAASEFYPLFLRAPAFFLCTTPFLLRRLRRHDKKKSSAPSAQWALILVPLMPPFFFFPFGMFCCLLHCFALHCPMFGVKKNLRLLWRQMKRFFGPFGANEKNLGAIQSFTPIFKDCFKVLTLQNLVLQ